MKNRQGMALVMVLSMSMFLMMLGISYLNSVSNVSTSNPKKLIQLQNGYFAHGIQKLALLKFRLFPADFYHAYRHNVERSKTPPNPLVSAIVPSPISAFLGNAGTILQSDIPIDTSIATPTKIISYSTNYIVSSSKKFDKDILTIVTNSAMADFSQTYKVSFNIERILIP